MKKVLRLLLLVLCTISIVGCGDNGMGNELGNVSKRLSTKDLSINDFECITEKTYINGEKVYTTTLSNNSNYDLIGVEIRFGIKEEVNEEQLKVYSDFVDKHKEYMDDKTLHDLTLTGSIMKLVKAGEMNDSLVLFNGIDNLYWYELPTDEQFNLMEAKELQLGLIGKDKILYLAYYDFKNDSWALDKNTKELNIWPENELSTLVNKPESQYCVLMSDVEDDDISFTAFDATKEMFDNYVSLMKENGFTVDIYESSNYFSADTANEENVSVTYNKENKTLTVYAYN